MDSPDHVLDKKHAVLKERLGRLGSVLVAFSGGVDSALLLRVTHDVLGEACLALTARSPSIPETELTAACRIVAEMGVSHLVIDSGEMDDPRYTANPPERCYYCKSELFEICRREAKRLGLRWVADGLNADDLDDHRPGIVAAREQGVLHPLADAVLTKKEIRLLAQRLGMEIWAKPAAACLASRFPYGTEITADRLGQVGRCEAILRTMGFVGVRVRYHGDVARIELAAADIPTLVTGGRREEIVRAFREEGFLYVCLDLQGYRTGSLNEPLKRKQGDPAMG